MNIRYCFYTILSAALLLTTSCEEPDKTAELFRLEKQFWDVADYQNAVYKIESTVPGQKKPCYADPARTAVFTKLVDKKNLSVVIEDEALGIGHRSEFASGMFDQSRDMLNAYSELDREDKFVYPMELVEVMAFSLYLQPHYFELGNQKILKEADDPSEARIQSLISGNNQTLISNYTLYLDYVEQEKAFTPEALTAYVALINEYYPKLIDAHPGADFTLLREKTSDMMSKAESADLKSALNNIITKVDALKNVVVPAEGDSLMPAK